MKTLSGKEWERLIDARSDKEEAKGTLTQDRCGVQVKFDPNSRLWSPVSSFPDREGVLMGGRQFIFDAKVISGASLSMQPDKTRPRQIRTLFRRGLFGSISFLLVHCNPRELKTKSEEAMTVAIPMHPKHPLWGPFLDGKSMSVRRETMLENGIIVPWNKANHRDRKYLPDLLWTIQRMAELLDGMNAKAHGAPTKTDDGASCEASCSAAAICENYIEILKSERDALPPSETSILRSLDKEVDRLHGVVNNLKQNAEITGGDQPPSTNETPTKQ